jgi:AraC family transcriptional regulator
MFDSCSETATYTACPPGPCVTSIDRFRPRAVRRAIEYMRANLSHSVRLEDIAGAVGLSIFHFSRTFRHTTGLPPHRYLTHARIERVKVLLLESEQSLAAIADETGFSDQSHMSKIFRRLAGTTPKQFRDSRRAAFAVARCSNAREGNGYAA